MRRRARDSLGLFLLCIAIPLLVGFVTRPTLYAALWIASHISSGLALYLIWRHRLSNPRVRPAVTLWILQFILCTAWSLVFFKLHWRWSATAILLLFTFALLFTMLLFQPLSKLAAILMLPVLLYAITMTFTH